VIAGDQVLMWLAVAGVATLLVTSASLSRSAMAGCGLPAWLGWKLLTAKPGDTPVLNIHRPRQYFNKRSPSPCSTQAIVFCWPSSLFVDVRHQGLVHLWRHGGDRGSADNGVAWVPPC
jgi:hypothetical protein